MTYKEALDVVGKRDPFYPLEAGQQFRAALSALTAMAEENAALKAEVDALRPLLEAVKNAETIVDPLTGQIHINAIDEDDIMFKALAYREGKEKK